MFAIAVVFVVAALAGVLSGVVGTGSSLILLPILIGLYGPRVAVPVMGIAAVLGNTGRVLAWRRQVSWRPVAAYASTGIPAAALGAHVLLTIPPHLVDAALAFFFAAMIPIRRKGTGPRRPRLRHMAVAGAIVGFLTGLIISTGPLSVPIFTGYGLAGGAFLGSEAAAALLLYGGKLATFGLAGALDGPIVARGLTVGAALMAGSLAGRPIVGRLGARHHDLMIDAVLLIAAAAMAVTAIS